MYGKSYISSVSTKGIMRKLTIKIKPNLFLKKSINQVLEKTEKIEFEELLRMDFEKGIKVIIVNITLKEGVKFEDLKWPNYLLLIEVIHQQGNTYTTLLKNKVPKFMMKITKKFNIDLIWDKPTHYMNDEMTYSCIGKEKDLQRFIRVSKLIGKIKSISYNNADYRGHNLTTDLTEKQKEIFNNAKLKGYYKYPREINATKLAKEIGISKPTLIEHLRKIENKLFSKINS